MKNILNEKYSKFKFIKSRIRKIETWKFIKLKIQKPEIQKRKSFQI